MELAMASRCNWPKSEYKLKEPIDYKIHTRDSEIYRVPKEMLSCLFCLKQEELHKLLNEKIYKCLTSSLPFNVGFEDWRKSFDEMWPNVFEDGNTEKAWIHKILCTMINTIYNVGPRQPPRNRLLSELEYVSKLKQCLTDMFRNKMPHMNESGVLKISMNLYDILKEFNQIMQFNKTYSHFCCIPYSKHCRKHLQCKYKPKQQRERKYKPLFLHEGVLYRGDIPNYYQFY